MSCFIFISLNSCQQDGQCCNNLKLKTATHHVLGHIYEVSDVENGADLSHYARIHTLLLMEYPMHVDRIRVELLVKVSINDVFLSLYLRIRLGISSVQRDKDILIWSSSQLKSCVGSKYLCSWLIKDSDSY